MWFSTMLQSFATLLAAAALLAPATGQTTRASVNSNGAQANLLSALGGRSVFLSPDGRHVAFESRATNLVPGDTNGTTDVFVRDLLAGTTVRVNLLSSGAQSSQGAQLPVLSADGRIVAFVSPATDLVPGDTNGNYDVFVHDRSTGQTSCASVDSAGILGNGFSFNPSISADGRFVAFGSLSDNLVPGDSNGCMDVFVHDRLLGQTTRVSRSSLGVEGNDESLGPALSADGMLVAFGSEASNLVPGDLNGSADVFVHDRATGQTRRVSVDSAGAETAGAGTFATISADGRLVAFSSLAANLVPGDGNGESDVFVHDLQAGTTERISISSTGAESNDWSNVGWPGLSADGRFCLFESFADNLVPGDTNGHLDVFLHDRLSGRTERMNVTSGGAQANGTAPNPSLANSGRVCAFASRATNLVPGDTNDAMDVFVHRALGWSPFLSQTGNCPGSVTLTVEDATPLGAVAVLGGAAGTFRKPSAPCAGMFLDVSPPLRVAAVTAGFSGVAVLTWNVPAALCGLSVQAVDVATCRPTNVVVL